MALYVPDSTRRRRLVLVAAGCLVVGLVVGLLVGRSTAPGVDDAESAVLDQAQDAITALERLPIEYEQALAGAGGEDATTITDALDRASSTLDGAYDEIDVFGPAARATTDAAFDELGQVVDAGGSQDEFEAAVDRAIVAIEDTFGL